MSDLNEAISLHRELLSLHPAPHPGRPQVLRNLASALETKSKENDNIQSDDSEATLLLRQEALAMSS